MSEAVKAEAKLEPGLEGEPCVLCGAPSASVLGAEPAGVLSEYCVNEALDAFAACSACSDLLQVLHAARLHYVRLRDALERLLTPNPLFLVPPKAQAVASAEPETVVKEEPEEPTYDVALADDMFAADSDNEPLLHTKKRRLNHKASKKKSVSKSGVRKKSWESNKPKSEEFILPDHENHNIIELKIEEETAESLVANGKARVNGCAAPPAGRGRPRGATAGHRARPAKSVHPCDQCNSKFSTLERLQQHSRRHAAGPFICEVCGAHYKHRRACDVHIAMHRGISDWKCEPCNRLFPSKGALQRHNNIHTGKLNYQCEECGKSFIHTSSFKMHALTHTGLKPHKCGVCGLGLLTSSHLKRHLRVHSGEKRYSCPVCGKRFSERYNLAAHSKSHDPLEESSAAGGTQRAKDALNMPFRCSYCTERFPRKYMLERHCSAAHGRPLERAPARPRNTLSKLLKARAAAGSNAHSAAPPHPEAAVKEDPSPPASCESPPAPPAPAQDASPATAECASQAALGTWGLPQYRA